MKFSIFLTAAALAQNQVIVTRQDGSSNPVDATPGACRGLGGAPINGVKVPPGLVVQFFEKEGCQGNNLGFGIREYFHPYGNPGNIKSIKVINERGPTPNNAAYYGSLDSWPLYYQGKRPNHAYYNLQGHATNDFNYRY
ncbi:hypothetical protein CONCODRAFT_169251 [Conidiobolus coronatus NRRL 28638]|uniref:Uncharacterized protein n=1 Tax=Conidiobolus coronatus (strain ATCC 28846 / CBS 209.66 / NRRL 28638) TaxID=796925 RepID=A0A137NSA7_CONC2|nr:hypothetical protein CONCODRAFT_169251 [Conidiobolus coronatus NRRL 28638]|eukprot:KXN65570.1 hypothetical protein CONCODRAFT_169251 [Conidiobolus coronatus NRRL 28638]